MKKKLTSFVALTAIISSVFVGCGSSNSTTASNSSTAASSSTSIATESTASDNAGSAQSAADAVTLKFDLTVSLDHPWGVAASKFKEDIENKSNGRLKVEIYPSSTSGSEADSLAGMLIGTTSMTMTGGSFNGYAPSATLLEAPYAYDSEEDVQAMCEGDIGAKIKKDFEDQKFHVLWYQLRGPRELTSNTAVTTPEDIKGKKMRMSGNTLHTNMWNAAGAVTSSIALSETFNALSQGVVEMQENPYDMIYDNSFYEVQKYVNETNHVYSTIFVVINSDLYNGLDDDLKKIIDDESAEMQTFVNDYYYEHKDEYKKKCEEAGMTINEDVDIDSFKKVMEPAIQKYLEDQGADLWDTYQQIQKLSASNN